MSLARNIALYPWIGFLSGLIFWQAVWFLFFQAELSAAQAIMIYVIHDISATLLEVPSGYFSDRIGRRFTLLISGATGAIACFLQAFGSDFAVFALAQVFLGAHMAFASGTDTSLLYESLNAEGRGEEVEQHEVRAWRYSFVALALSAPLGGLMMLGWDRLPYLATGLAFVALLAVVFALREPPHATQTGSERARLRTLWAQLRQPALLWLFVISVLMYGFSHIPFVFGQPFILNAMAQIGYDAEAPLISGAITATMMVLSVIVSLAAPGLRKRLGIAALVLLAFAMQVALAALLALTQAPWAIGLLVLRMVPDSLSTPFIRAHIQPFLSDESRATYLSLRSLAGRVVFAASLAVAAGAASNVGEMSAAEISAVLRWYAIAGLGLLLMLWLIARRIPIDAPPPGPR